MKTTNRNLYRDEDGRWYLNNTPFNEELRPFSPGDFLDGNTILHVFSTEEEAYDYLAQLEEDCNELDLNYSFTAPQLLEGDNKWGIVVEEHDEQSQSNSVLEIVH